MTDQSFPDYLLYVVAREAFEKDGLRETRWEDLPDVDKAGWLETAKVILSARASQSDIKR